jgi:signal transduction histidine kinase
LSISYGIIKNHQGEITVDSQPGEGATFTVLLPVKSGAPVPFLPAGSCK